jgi:hypothetical protein
LSVIIRQCEGAVAVFTAIDIIKDVQSQVALITLRTDDIGLLVEGVLVMEPLKKKIKHDEPPFVSPVLKSVDWYDGGARQGDQCCR